jgi:acetolactate synthase-1/2/3 large subunit
MKQPPKISGARFIAETFSGYGVTHVFYVEGILRLALVEMEALGIRRILAHSEKAAAYMADGYARVSHRPGICMAQSVGAANLAAGLQDPYLGGSPVIALTGRRPPLAQYRNAYQEIAHGPMFQPVTKYSATVDSVHQLPLLLRQAFRAATSGGPRPVHLDVVGHLGEEIAETEAELAVVIEEPFTRYPSNRPVPEWDRLQNAARMLENAERPVIVAGGGVPASSARSELIALAERLSIPVATSLTGKGSIPESHDFSLGVVGSYSCPCANQVVWEADLVLFVGSRTGDQVTNNWTVPPLGIPMIQIDIEGSQLGINYPSAFGLMGDAKATLRKLTEYVEPKADKANWSRRAQRLVRQWRREIERLGESSSLPTQPERLCREIARSLPCDAILVSDTGFSAMWSGTMIPLTDARQRFIRAAGSLGWGFPASLGAKCAAPDAPVICFTGDGGFMYHLSELETASRCGIKTVTIVNNNSSFRQCMDGVNRAYGNRTGMKEELYAFTNVNFAKIAEEMGCLGIRVEQPDKISDALKTAMAADVPVVVDVVTDRARKPSSPWTPKDSLQKDRHVF